MTVRHSRWPGLRTDLAKLVVSFLLSLGVFAVAIGLYVLQSPDVDLTMAGSFALLSAIVAAILALPMLVLACLALAVFHKRIRHRAGLWSLMAPVLVALTYAATNYLFRHADMTITAYLANPALLMQIAYAAFISAVTAVIFYVWALRSS